MLRDKRPTQIRKYCDLDETCQALIKDGHAAIAAGSSVHSPCPHAQPDDCRHGGVAVDHPYPPGRGAAEPAEAGVDVTSVIFWCLNAQPPAFETSYKEADKPSEKSEAFSKKSTFLGLTLLIGIKTS